MESGGVQNFLQESIVRFMIEGTVKACFEKCVTRPQKELSANEKQCLAMCQDRYQEAFQKTFFRQYEELSKALSESQMQSSFGFPDN
mmetsp:Transcript_5031/g.7594  ORF Transcript_5031/g.7594 Transcript_5031/m.7594 type:complete len:87 (+) Transcript_5031:707-967(+)